MIRRFIFLILPLLPFLSSCRNERVNSPTVTIDTIAPVNKAYEPIPDSLLIRYRNEAFKQVRTTKIIISQDLGDAQGVVLPVKEDVSRLLRYAGVQENDSLHDMIVRVNFKGKALAWEYRKRNDGGISGRHYTTAKVSAELIFELPSGQRVRGESEYSSRPPETIYEEYLTPASAPFARDYSIPLANAFFRCVYPSLGLLPVIEIANHKGWEHFGDQADSFLLELRDDKAVSPLIAGLQHQAVDEAELNGTLVTALGLQRNAGAIKPLFAVMKSHNRENRILAEKALDKTDPKWPSSARAIELLPTLYPALSDNDNELRLFTVHIIGRVKNRQSIWYLVLLSSDQDLFVRTEARKILKTDFPGWASSEEAMQTIPYLVPFCAGKDEGIRQSVGETLSAIDPGWTSSEGALSAVPRLIASLADRDREIRGNTAELMGKIKDPRAVKPLIDLLADDSRYTRERAIRALGELGDKAAVEPLISLAVSAGEAYVTEAVRDALLMITGKDPGADYKSWPRWAALP